MAYHASRIGVRAEIAACPCPHAAGKGDRDAAWGAKVILYGNNFDEALEEARRREQDEKLVFVHAFDDDAVIAGQGVIGLELSVEQIPDLEAVVVPVGGGGLIGGVACALVNQRQNHGRRCGSSVCRQRRYRRMQGQRWSAHHLILLAAAPTIADGIAVRQTGERTLALAQNMQWTTS